MVHPTILSQCYYGLSALLWPKSDLCCFKNWPTHVAMSSSLLAHKKNIYPLYKVYLSKY